MTGEEMFTGDGLGKCWMMKGQKNIEWLLKNKILNEDVRGKFEW